MKSKQAECKIQFLWRLPTHKHMYPHTHTHKLDVGGAATATALPVAQRWHLGIYAHGKQTAASDSRHRSWLAHRKRLVPSFSYSNPVWKAQRARPTTTHRKSTRVLKSKNYPEKTPRKPLTKWAVSWGALQLQPANKEMIKEKRKANAERECVCVRVCVRMHG